MPECWPRAGKIHLSRVPYDGCSATAQISSNILFPCLGHTCTLFLNKSGEALTGIPHVGRDDMFWGSWFSGLGFRGQECPLYICSRAEALAFCWLTGR